MNSDPDPVREYYRLDTLLNAVSAREAYNSIYRQPVSRETVMELLILRNDVPRSLRASISDLVGQLEQIANDRSHLPLRLGAPAQRRPAFQHPRRSGAGRFTGHP